MKKFFIGTLAALVFGFGVLADPAPPVFKLVPVATNGVAKKSLVVGSVPRLTVQPGPVPGNAVIVISGKPGVYTLNWDFKLPVRSDYCVFELTIPDSGNVGVGVGELAPANFWVLRKEDPAPGQ